LLLAALLAIVAGACDDSGTDEEGFISDNTVRLLGLQEDFDIEYISYDSVITYPPLRIEIDTTVYMFSGRANSGSPDRIDLFVDSVPIAALRITDNSIVNLGYYVRTDGGDSLLQFSELPLLFPIAFVEENRWESYTPPMFVDGQAVIESMLFLSWGFETTRKFVRRENILVPAGRFNSFVIKCDRILPGDDEAFSTSYEYYADGVGLVRLYSAGSFGSTHLFMRSYVHHDQDSL
jgi:hypothetical protein